MVGDDPCSMLDRNCDECIHILEMDKIIFGWSNETNYPIDFSSIEVSLNLGELPLVFPQSKHCKPDPSNLIWFTQAKDSCT